MEEAKAVETVKKAKQAVAPEPAPATVKVVKFYSVKRASAPAGPPANVLKDGDEPLFQRSECYVSWYEVQERLASDPPGEYLETYRKQNRLYVRLSNGREVEIAS